MEYTTEEIMTGWPKMPCICGRMVRVHPETGKAAPHHPANSHPTLTHYSKEQRKKLWCPEVQKS